MPDYLTAVKGGGFYGWPYSYFGQHIDSRVEPQRPDLVAKAIVPDYALGNHVAPLGLSFAHSNRLPEQFKDGAFIGLHGSWNRKPRAGYKVVFVPFASARGRRRTVRSAEHLRGGGRRVPRRGSGAVERVDRRPGLRCDDASRPSRATARRRGDSHAECRARAARPRPNRRPRGRSRARGQDRLQHSADAAPDAAADGRAGAARGRAHHAVAADRRRLLRLLQAREPDAST